MTLWPYQQRFLADIRRAYALLRARGVRCPRILAVLPTGGGKTVCFVDLARSAVAKGGRVLILAHRDDLVTSAADKLRAEGERVGVVMAGVEPDPEAPIQVCIAQTLRAREYAPDGITHVIIDEGHHATAGLWADIVRCYGGALVVIIAFTATPSRGDGTALADAFDVLVQGPTVEELTALGFLSPSKVWRPSERVSHPSRDALEVILSHRDRLSVTFARSVGESREIMVRAAAACWPLLHVDANTTRREDRLALVGTSYRGVVNQGVLTEGWDCPAVSLVVLASAPGHVTSYMQRIGRGIRMAPGKVNVLIYDLFGVSHDLGLPDDPRVWNLGGESGAPVKGSLSSATCKACGFGYRWAPRCPSCGHKSAPKPLKRVKWRELTEAQREKRGSSPVGFLAYWGGVMAGKGQGQGALSNKFKGVFQRWPTDAELMEAVVMRDKANRARAAGEGAAAE